MDSIKHLKAKFIAFTRRTLANHAQSNNALFCLEFGNSGFTCAYVTTTLGKPRLEFLETVACDVTKPLPVLSEFVKSHNLTGVNCSWLLKADKYQLINIDELPVKAEEFQAAVRWQIKKLLSFSVDNAFIDSFPVPRAQIPNPKKMITVVAAQADYIQGLAEQIAASGLQLTTIDIQELALRNVAAMYETKDLSTAVVYLQEKNSDIIFTRQEEFYFLRRLDWSFEKLANNFENQESLNLYLQKLALEVQRSFDYFQSQWRMPPPSHVYMVSLNPNVLDIAAYMSQRLRFPIENINLTRVLPSRMPLTSDLESQYLSVIGGALRQETSYAPAN